MKKTCLNVFTVLVINSLISNSAFAICEHEESELREWTSRCENLTTAANAVGGVGLSLSLATFGLAGLFAAAPAAASIAAASNACRIRDEKNHNLNRCREAHVRRERQNKEERLREAARFEAERRAETERLAELERQQALERQAWELREIQEASDLRLASRLDFDFRYEQIRNSLIESYELRLRNELDAIRAQLSINQDRDGIREEVRGILEMIRLEIETERNEALAELEDYYHLIREFL